MPENPRQRVNLAGYSIQLKGQNKGRDEVSSGWDAGDATMDCTTHIEQHRSFRRPDAPSPDAATLIVISTPASALQPVAAEAWTGHIPPLSWRHQPVYLVVATSIVTNYE